MKKWLSMIFLSGITLISGQDPLIQKILALPENTGGEIVYFNDFSDPSKTPDFRKVSQFSLDSSGGENGTAAVKCEKTDPSKLEELNIR